MPTTEHAYGSHPRQAVTTRMHNALRAGVLFIHGGGWENGDKEVWEPKAAELFNAGYNTWNMNYRLTGDCSKPWEDITWDVARTVAMFIGTEQLKSLTLVGDSAGGHLALNYAMSRPGAINSVVALSPVTDPIEWRRTSPYFAEMYSRFVGGTYEQQPQRWAQFSPRHRLHAGAKPPRTYIYGSRADTITPCAGQVDAYYHDCLSFGRLISGAAVKVCQTRYPDHGTRLLPCAWGSVKSFLPQP